MIKRFKAMHGRGSVLVDTSKISFIYSDNIVKCDGTVFVDMIIDGQKVNYSLTKDELENLMSEKEQAMLDGAHAKINSRVETDDKISAQKMVIPRIAGFNIRDEVILRPGDDVSILSEREDHYKDLIVLDLRVNERLLTNYPVTPLEYPVLLRFINASR